MANIHPACKPVAGANFNVLTVKVEKEGSKFTAKLHIVVERPYTKEISLVGPLRDTRPEAIKDGMELGKRYVVEGEAGARTVLLRLKKKKWTPQETKDADEKALQGFVVPGLQGNKEPPPKVEGKLLPPGEGWSRHNDELLVHDVATPPVYFATTGPCAGQYLRQTGSAWEVVSAPHAPREHSLRVLAGSASCSRKGGKLDRAVLLPDITRIARLALKMPLSFVDRPACAYAVFQGLRSSESAQWCAENCHKKLLQRLARKIHGHDVTELQDIVRATLEELDEELLKTAHAFSGCSALVALILGDKLVVAGVGQVRVVLLPDGGEPRLLLACAGNPEAPEELERVRQAGGAVHAGLIGKGAKDLDEAGKILSAASAFDVLQVPEGGPADGGQVRSSYRRLALRVHPDKVAEEASAAAFTAAFARLDSAKEAVEAMLSKDSEACRQLCRVLRAEVHTRAGALGLLGTDDVEEAEKACRKIEKDLALLQGMAPEHEWGVAAGREAVETLRRACTPEALPRQEALLREAVPTGRALGLRDLRRPRPVVLMQPETAAHCVPAGTSCRLGVLCGAAAALDDAHMAPGATGRFARRPRASALRWCLDAGEASGGSAVCVSLAATRDADAPAAKRPRASEQGPEGTVRVRHILLRHRQLRPDPMARREGDRSLQDAEEAALKALEELLSAKEPDRQFLRLCRELSDCQSATQPGALAGDLGWLARGQQEQVLEDAIWALGVKEFGDVLVSQRGVHVIQRLA